MLLLKNCVYFEDLKILAAADLHIGYEASLIGAGFLVPRVEKKEIIENFKEIFFELEKEGKKIKEIVICGDLKHAFGGFSLEEWKDVREVLKFLSKHGKVILLRGNHDKYLDALKEDHDLKDFYIKDGVCFFHGNKMYKECFKKNIKKIIMGDVHPIAVIKEGVKQEKYRCFLVGKLMGKEIIIMPAFNPLLEVGWDVSIGEINEFNIRNFDVYIIGGRVYDFGKVKDLKKRS